MRGTYHLTAGGETSWHGFTQLILEAAIKNGQSLRTLPSQVVPITTADYQLPAERPANSRLEISRLNSTFGLVLPQWRHHAERAVVEVIE